MPHRTLRPSASGGSRAAILAEVNSAPLTALQRQGRHPEHTQVTASTTPRPELLRDRPAAQSAPAGSSQRCRPQLSRARSAEGATPATERPPSVVLSGHGPQTVPCPPSGAHRSEPVPPPSGAAPPGHRHQGPRPGRYRARLGRAARAAGTAFKVRTAAGPGPRQPQGEGS